MKRKIKEIVEQNYTDPNFDVNKLAKILGISRIYLNTRIQFDFYCTPHCFIELIRISYAKKLLLEEHTIIEVCEKIGYSHKKTFYRVFKKRTRMTPKEFVAKKKSEIRSQNLEVRNQNSKI